MKDSDGMTFLPDLMSSRLLAVAIFSQRTIRIMSGQKAICQGAAGIGPGQFSCLQCVRRQ